MSACFRQAIGRPSRRTPASAEEPRAFRRDGLWPNRKLTSARCAHGGWLFGVLQRHHDRHRKASADPDRPVRAARLGQNRAGRRPGPRPLNSDLHGRSDRGGDVPASTKPTPASPPMRPRRRWRTKIFVSAFRLSSMRSTRSRRRARPGATWRQSIASASRSSNASAPMTRSSGSGSKAGCTAPARMSSPGRACCSDAPNTRRGPIRGWCWTRRGYPPRSSSRKR